MEMALAAHSVPMFLHPLAYGVGDYEVSYSFIVVDLALHAVLFLVKNVHAVTQLLLDGTRSVLYHLICEKMSKIIAIQS